MLNISVFRWLQQQDDDEGKSWMTASREFQAAGPQTVKLQDPNRNSLSKYATITKQTSSEKRIMLQNNAQ